MWLKNIRFERDLLEKLLVARSFPGNRFTCTSKMLLVGL